MRCLTALERMQIRHAACPTPSVERAAFRALAFTACIETCASSLCACFLGLRAALKPWPEKEGYPF